MPSSYHTEKKYSSKQVVSMVHKLGKDFFAFANLKGFRDVFFQAE